MPTNVPDRTIVLDDPRSLQEHMEGGEAPAPGEFDYAVRRVVQDGSVQTHEELEPFLGDVDAE